MPIRTFLAHALVWAAALHTSGALAQSSEAASGAAPAPASAAKRELVARVLKIQQPAVENLGRTLAEQPAAQLIGPARAVIARLPQDKREAVARQIEADMQRYAEEAVPIVRDRALALAPTLLAPMIEQRFTEDELRQLVAILESPINARYQALGLEMQRALGGKVVADTRAAVEPKFKALEQSITTRLRNAAANTGAASAPANAPAAGPGPGPRAASGSKGN